MKALTPAPELLTLAEACETVLRNMVRPSTLRAAAARGELAFIRLGRRDFTTAADITAWIDQCRARARAHTSGSDQPSQAAAPSGSSSTVVGSNPQAAALTIVQGLKNALPATSSRSSARKARATLIASR